MAQTVVNGVLYLDIEFQESPQTLDIFLDSGSQTLEVEMVGGSEGRLPYYLGETTVEPRKVEQILETANKSMRDNVTIKPIYYAETSTAGGGYTAIIGLE